MKKLFLAASICASILASSPAWAAETVEKIAGTEQAQSEVAEAAALSWAKDLARDMQLSADPLARAMAEVSLQLLLAKDRVEAFTSRLTPEQKVALYSDQTPVPVRILYLQAACAGFYKRDALCGDTKLSEALIAADAQNAFTILLAESVRVDAEMRILRDLQDTQKPTDKQELDKNEPLIKAQGAKNAARVLLALRASNQYYDYAQAFKAPILIAVKRRPPPPEVFASLPLEVSALAAAFAPEEVAAEAFANAFIASAESSFHQISACARSQDNELKSECARIADLVLANPKNSVVSAGFALSRSENHPYLKTMLAFGSTSSQKAFDPINLLTLDWLALRSVLNKAATQGDVAAIPDALAWAELAYAKIPNKSAEVIAAESKALSEQQARWEAERNRMPNGSQTPEAAAAVAAAAEARSAAELELTPPPPPPPPKPSSGCSASDEKIDPTVIEFKN